MEAREVSNQENIDSKRPGGVALAAIWLMISSGASFVSVLMGGNFSGLSIALMAFSVIAFLTSFAAIALKKWAYWVFLTLVVLLGLNNISDVMLWGLGVSPDQEFQISFITSILIPVAITAYFCTQPVKQAFGVDWGESN
jgi:phosphatidylserine synthase